MKQTEINRNKIQDHEALFRAMIEQAPVATCLFTGPELKVDVANDLMISYWGKDRSILGLPLAEAVPELEGQPYLDILKDVYHSGKTYSSKSSPAQLKLDGKISTYYFDFTYQPLKDETGHVYGVMDMAVDVTREVLAHQQLQESQLFGRTVKQRADLAIELAEVGVYEVDLLTDEAIVDARFSEIMGVPNLTNRSEYVKLFHPDDLPARDAAYKELGVSGKYDYQARLMPPGMAQKWIRSTGRIILDAKGNPTKLMGLIQDITRQKAYEESLATEVLQRTEQLRDAWSSLEKSNAYLQVVLNNFETAFASLEPIMEEDGKIIDFRFKKSNDAYSAYSHVSPFQIENQPVSVLFPEYYQTEAFSRYVETYETGKENAWAQHYNVDGLDVHLQINARRIGDEVIMQVIDFTTVKSLQQDLLRKIEELERSNRNLEEFAYAASHDLKEPIRKILFMSDLLNQRLAGQLNEKDQHLFHRMENAGRRMHSLVEDLLSYSQVNMRPPERSKVELNDIVALVLGDLELEIQQKNASIELNVICALDGHPRQLQQVFHNLIGNALKYASADRTPSIKINCKNTPGRDIPVSLSMQQQQQNFHEVTVSDNGIGLESKDAERIFDVFTRLHGSEFVRGTGVGLAIVRKVMENHHGFVRAESAPEQGTTFYLYFPEK